MPKIKLGKRAKIALGVVAAVIALCGFGAALSGGDEPAAAPANAAAAPAAATEGTQPAVEPVATTEAPALTVPQQNAARQAQNYLDLKGFSRSGLIKQLEFEGYSTDDATVGVDSIGVDWMVQAERSAASYLALTAFSRSGLIDQLVFEGFTPDEAAHGADSVGL